MFADPALIGSTPLHSVGWLDAASTYWHQTCSAKMGQDPMSVVDSQLRVYGIEHLRIADGSIMPRVTTGNTMAHCIIIGERAAEILPKHASAPAPAPLYSPVSAGKPFSEGDL